jgi:hypothetical protein
MSIRIQQSLNYKPTKALFLSFSFFIHEINLGLGDVVLNSIQQKENV